MNFKRDLQGIYTIWLRDLTRFFRNRARIISSLMQPLLYLAIFGSGFAAMLRGGLLGFEDINYSAFIYPGVIGLTVLFTSLFTAISIIYDREFGFLKEVMVAPVSRAAVALGKVAGGSTVALLQGSIMIALAPLVGLRLGWQQILAMLVVMLALAAASTALGILVAARQRSFEAFQIIINFLIMPMFLLSGALFPLTGLPGWLSVLVRLNPMAYATNALRQIALAGNMPTEFLAQVSWGSVNRDLFCLALFFLVFLIPGVWAFSKRD
jgi:ABC-2 type transport system permease protein